MLAGGRNPFHGRHRYRHNLCGTTSPRRDALRTSIVEAQNGSVCHQTPPFGHGRNWWGGGSAQDLCQDLTSSPQPQNYATILGWSILALPAFLRGPRSPFDICLGVPWPTGKPTSQNKSKMILQDKAARHLAGQTGSQFTIHSQYSKPNKTEGTPSHCLTVGTPFA